ncbi:hypothetical protein [Tenacibaculum finnmarkense]|uniref:hypothetical protein n=1 Tax=Tenacibaculum finnmarkense TaxID=2781243 RepID=UPI001EFBAA46|nr:hypothetical protein [Tenacibaculum finnmarkense]MCG8207854.1 hypothetical protein [Tenacibaculum finnmarkense genomovar finnmarkense]MCG8723916.1 hypothetical protein [Tenacibaculum finnmarkense]MCG8765635.1 hypothetical protein [Tenacibaculum finnmarkense]MCG8778549.1 hypothetical protein [Tenacibaculum finnmarkense]MCM8907040.1 hypothetical protein [Tenacibaculum finnmarkense genomovar finnmarkense]
MVKLYELNRDFNGFGEWNVILSSQEDSKYSVISNLENDDKIDLPEGSRIKMHLLNIESDKSLRKKSLF